MRKLVRAGALVPLACAGLALSGCGLANESLPRPDTAAVVGSETLSFDDVEGGADAVCSALDDLPDTVGASPVPRATVDAVAEQYAVYRAVAEQIAAEYGVDGGDYYAGVVSSYEQQFAGAADLDEVVDTVGGAEYLIAVSVQAAGGSLDGDGISQEQATAAIDDGLALARSWVEKNGLEVNPRLPDVEIGDASSFGQISTGSDELSIAVSDEAKTAEKELTGTLSGSEDAATLPDDERCGA